MPSPVNIRENAFVCVRCLQARNGRAEIWRTRRGLSTGAKLREANRDENAGYRKKRKDEEDLPSTSTPDHSPSNGSSQSSTSSNGASSSDVGAMTRRLQDLTEQSVQEGGKRARKAMEEGGFSEELIQKLEQRIADDNKAPKLDSAAAHSVLSMPSTAGQATRDTAMAKPWAGSETLEQTALRMLNDAYKPLRERIPKGRVSAMPRMPSTAAIDTRLKKTTKGSSGERLANARDKTSIYAVSQDPNLSDKEKEDMRKILRERFQPGARPMPTSIQGLASLANERIEDAIARGQFKNIPRGKGVNREIDYNANSPFLDTTEYFMNKMIQRQDIVPPWIEKQQEVIKTAQTFRSRIRNDWRRHAARMIASKGGSLSEQIRRAEAHARAETELNPKLRKVEGISRIDSAGKLTHVVIEEEPVVSESVLPNESLAQGSNFSNMGEVAVAGGAIKVTVLEEQRDGSAAAVADAVVVAKTTTAAGSVTSEADGGVSGEAQVENEGMKTGNSGEGVVAAAAAAPLLETDGYTSADKTRLTSDGDVSSDKADGSSAIGPISQQPQIVVSQEGAQHGESPQKETTQLLRLPPFRDPDWESIEQAYHVAALRELNNLTRSYNLMAPRLAQRPYYSLARELSSCFADVAPQLAEAITERARRPEKIRVEVIGHKQGGVLDRFSGGQRVEVYDSKRPHYGFREFWSELWGKKT